LRTACADDIRRAGFPLLFWEEGGFSYRNNYDQPALLADLEIGLGCAVLTSLASNWRRIRRDRRRTP
jgi:hypothetical protein